MAGEAEWFTADHALDYGYGPQSPLGKLVEANGKMLMLGAPLDTMTLLHHAEHLADIPDKRIIRYEAPILVDGKTVWRRFEEFDTPIRCRDGLPDDYFATIVEAFLAPETASAAASATRPSVLVPAAEMVGFGVEWLESRFGVKG